MIYDWRYTIYAPPGLAKQLMNSRVNESVRWTQMDADKNREKLAPVNT
jgi:hypothetical protein